MSVRLLFETESFARFSKKGQFYSGVEVLCILSAGWWGRRAVGSGVESTLVGIVEISDELATPIYCLS
jgi:hypothetical protein